LIHDDTSNANVGGCGTLTNSGATAAYGISGVTAGDHISVELDRVTNPGTVTGDKLTLSTSADSVTTVTSPDYPLTTPVPLQSLSAVLLSTTAAGATGVSYKFSFTTSGTGALAVGSTLTVVAPPGTVLPSCPLIHDDKSNTNVGGCGLLSNSNATATYGISGVNAGDHISVELDRVTNPTATSSGNHLTLSTSADTVTTPTTAPDYLSTPPQALANVSAVSASTISTGVSYQFSFNTSSTGALAVGSTLTVVAPPGTVLPSCPLIHDDSLNVNVGGCGLLSNSNATAVYGISGVNAGDRISVQLDRVTNPAGSTVPRLTLSTSADTVTTMTAPPGTATTAPPVPLTGPPTVTGSKDAGFSGTVNPEGLQTTAHFEYGLDAKYRAPGDTAVYDQRTPDQTVGSDTSPHPFSTSVSGLVPHAVYHVRLVATNSAGTIAGQDKTFMTAADPLPPAPVLGKTVNVAPVSGTVFVKLPGAGTASDHGLTKGAGFTPLTEARQLPSGTQVDSRFGFLKLIAATAASQHIGKTQSVTLGGGLFKLNQARTGVTKGLTTFSLLEGDFAGAPSYVGCGHAAADAPFAHAAISRRILQTLHSSGHGRFRTRGRYSAGTVRGTVWDTSDRCDGTLTVVRRGTVDVTDFRLRRTIPVRAGHSYLAKAR
jgi:hypothetical protein